MFISDGIVHAGEPARDICVAEARVVNDFTLLVTFTTGETRLFDATELFGIPAFSALEDASVFEAFRIERGILIWDNGKIDIAPEALYDHSYRYDRPA